MAARVTGDTSDATHLAGNAVTDRTKAPGACGSVDTHHAAEIQSVAGCRWTTGVQSYCAFLVRGMRCDGSAGHA